MRFQGYGWGQRLLVASLRVAVREPVREAHPRGVPGEVELPHLPPSPLGAPDPHLRENMQALLFLKRTPP